jgi:hypothetical protein
VRSKEIMKLFLSIVNYLFIGQYHARIKTKGVEFESEKHRRVVMDSLLIGPLFTVIFPLLMSIAFLLLRAVPSFIFSFRIFFGFSFLGIYLLTTYLISKYYLDNALYNEAIEEYNTLTENERKKRQITLVISFLLSVFGTIIFFVFMGILLHINNGK